MAKKEVVVCDTCQKQTECKSLKVYVGSSVSPAGCGRDYWHRYIDLCFSCLFATFHTAFDPNDYEENLILLQKTKLDKVGVVR